MSYLETMFKTTPMIVTSTSVSYANPVSISTTAPVIELWNLRFLGDYIAGCMN